jgi:hypothetical protein
MEDVKLYDNHCRDMSIGPPMFLSDVRLDYLQSCMLARPPFLLRPALGNAFAPYIFCPHQHRPNTPTALTLTPLLLFGTLVRG